MEKVRSGLDFNKAVSYIVTYGMRLYLSNEGHPAMCRSIGKDNVLCGGRFRLVDGILKMYSTTGYLPNTEVKHREMVETWIEEELAGVVNFVNFEWVK